jgi:hypothetical protein
MKIDMTMTRATLTKIIGTVASAVIATSGLYLPDKYRPIAMATATLIIGWLHLPSPGMVRR